jgi:hypothetical protein
MRMVYVGRVEGINRTDLDSHEDAGVLGKDALVFNNFNREVTVSCYYPAGETKLLRIIYDALGYVIPQTGKKVMLIIHQGIHLPPLDHNLLSIM